MCLDLTIRKAADRKTDCFKAALSQSTDQPLFVLGDFNMLSLSVLLPTLQLYVTCPTRSTHFLDQYYGNVEDAYKAVCIASIRKSNHNVISPLPIYRQLKLINPFRYGQRRIRRGSRIAQTGRCSLTRAGIHTS